MKTYLIYIAALVISLSSCNSTKWASADSYTDDLYYSSKDKPLAVSDEYIPVSLEKEVKRENRKEVNSMQSKYLRENPNYSMEQVTSDFSDIQSSYSQLLANDSISDIDTVLYYNDETGYWVDGFEGSTMDLDYATRIIRFHGPFAGVPYWSPLYTDVLFFNTWDWNVYVDNNYAYAFPSYTNSLYWNSSFRYGFGYRNMGFSMGYGWGYPGYGYGYPGYGWGYPGYGYGYPGYGWGYPGYGWGYPGYGCGYPGYGPGHPGHPIHPGYPSDNYYYGARVTNPTTGRMNAKQNSIANGPRTANVTSLKGVSSTRTTTTISPDNNLKIKKGSTTYTRVSRSNQAQSTGDKKSVSNRPGSSSNGSVNVRTTRKSYSSYSSSTSTKRPTFNRSTSSRSTGTTRKSNSSSSSRSNSIYSAPRRSSSTSARSSQTSSRSTYKTGSSKSSTSSPSRSSGSSSTKSSYSTPSRSSRSSGSSYSPSGSSSGSSGSSKSSSSSSNSTRSSRGSR